MDKISVSVISHKTNEHICFHKDVVINQHKMMFLNGSKMTFGWCNTL